MQKIPGTIPRDNQNRELVGATLYLAMHTRPDVAYAVGVLSRQCKQPSLAACKLMVYLLRYIQGSTDKGIRFSGSSFDLHVFSDLDWAGDRVTRRSTTGYIGVLVVDLLCGSLYYRLLCNP